MPYTLDTKVGEIWKSVRLSIIVCADQELDRMKELIGPGRAAPAIKWRPLFTRVIA